MRIGLNGQSATPDNTYIYGPFNGLYFDSVQSLNDAKTAQQTTNNALQASQIAAYGANIGVTPTTPAVDAGYANVQRATGGTADALTINRVIRALTGYGVNPATATAQQISNVLATGNPDAAPPGTPAPQTLPTYYPPTQIGVPTATDTRTVLGKQNDARVNALIQKYGGVAVDSVIALARTSQTGTPQAGMLMDQANTDAWMSKMLDVCEASLNADPTGKTLTASSSISPVMIAGIAAAAYFLFKDKF
jgi:hypothetical protein